MSPTVMNLPEPEAVGLRYLLIGPDALATEARQRSHNVNTIYLK